MTSTQPTSSPSKTRSIRSTLAASAIVAALAAAGCGSSSSAPAPTSHGSSGVSGQTTQGFHSATTLQDEIKLESVGRDPLTWVSCIETSGQEARCNATDTSGRSLALTVTINASGDHYLITNIQ
jgi:hypothetical protein